MPITLAEAKVGMASKVDQTVIETIRRNSRFMDMLVFDDAISPGTGGSTLVYGYTQLLTPGSASGRKINSEYTPQEAKRTTKTTTLTIMGGSYQIDRVLAKTSNQKINEVAFQNEQKSKATIARFQYLTIHGKFDTTKDTTSPEFDGLDSLLEGTGNDIDGSALDLTGEITEAKAVAFDEALRKAIKSVKGGKPNCILANGDMIVKMTTVARKLGFYTRGLNGFGEETDKYSGIELIDLEQYYNGTNTVDVIPIKAATSSTAGTTNIYLVRISASDGFCGVCPMENSIGLTVNLPDFSTAGAVKTGDVELVGGVALKDSLAAARIKDIKIVPKTA